MRTYAFLLTAALALATVPALASANQSHGNCGTSNTSIVIDPLLGGVDIWRTQCAGAALWLGDAFACNGFHFHTTFAHAMVLSPEECETGVLVGPLT